MIMSLFSKYVMFGSGALAATYLIYRVLKCRNKDEVASTNTEVADLDCSDEDDVLHNVQSGGFEQGIIEYDLNDTDVRKEVRDVEGVQLWIDEAVEEYYSLNEGPSSYQNIKQYVLDNLMECEVWNERNRENVKRYVEEFLSGERPIYIQEKISAEIPDVSSPDSEEEISSTEQEIETMCNRYFGITRHEYFALEEEYAKRLSGEQPGNTESVAEETETSPVIHRSDKENTSDMLVNGGSIRNLSCLEVKDDEINKKPKKGWKSWKKGISKFFKRDKDSKSK